MGPTRRELSSCVRYDLSFYASSHRFQALIRQQLPQFIDQYICLEACIPRRAAQVVKEVLAVLITLPVAKAAYTLCPPLSGDYLWHIKLQDAR